MNNNSFLTSPPMGWNSYDFYDTTVNEEEVRNNAEYMAKNLKEFGWEYIVVDIEWYSYNAGTRRDEHQYIPFEKVEMDEYSRLFPCLDRFPSSADGKGFKPLADYIHSLGLKFGIHIMRGIPRIAAHMHTKIKGTDVDAAEIADPYSICCWNPDMYGVRPDKEESQLYYDSLLELYAEWGVDFIKCDDICRMDMPSAEAEIIMLHRAIKKSGRDIVLSLSPGPAKLDKAWIYEKYSNMWRITDDFWDSWPLLLNMFERCEHWQNHVKEGAYPDCDMLPLGKVGKGFGNIRDTRFTKDEQVTMMSLWCIFRSPMMLGAELMSLDDDTFKLITNKDVLNLLKLKNQAYQAERTKDHAIWINSDDEHVYAAMFNISDEEQTVSYNTADKDVTEAYELWSGIKVTVKDGIVSQMIPAHGACIYMIK